MTNITQENVHLLIPSKISWMADMLVKDRGISVAEALKILYASKVYKKLELESTKAWHLGPVALYEELLMLEELQLGILHWSFSFFFLGK